MLTTITLTASTPVSHVSAAAGAVRLQAPGRPAADVTAHRLTARIGHIRAIALSRAHRLGKLPFVARAERVRRSPAFLRWELRLWQRRAATYRRILRGRAGVYDALLCIHRYEGAWNDDTGNGYYGGLQMSPGFMESYGSDFVRRFGVASNWPPAVQLAVAYRAVESVGYSPWPSTRIPCGV